MVWYVQMRYMLGDSGRSLIAGWGKNPPTHIQNRAASCPSAPENCTLVTHRSTDPVMNPSVCHTISSTCQAWPTRRCAFHAHCGCQMAHFQQIVWLACRI